MAVCEVAKLSSKGWTPICDRPATWLYTNGAYRRLECDCHAEMARRLIEPSDAPDAPKLTPLTPERA